MKIRSTQFRTLLALFFLASAHGLLPGIVRAETRTAAALTPEAVWQAFSAAQDGDIVQLPEGTAVWTNGWNSQHWAKMKAITIQGAGIDKTIIRTDTTTAPGDKGFVINGVEGKPFRITGITFDGTGFATAGTWADPKATELQAAHVKEGRDFFNEAPKPEYYRPFTYPPPLQGGREPKSES